MITAMLLMAGCGGADSHSNGHVGLYSPGSKTDEDVDKELKFDARVQNYSAEGDKLVVNVNESFASAPPGIQQRALGHWYSLWQAARTAQNSKPQKDLEVVVRFEGNELAKWTRDERVQAVQRRRQDDDKASLMPSRSEQKLQPAGSGLAQGEILGMFPARKRVLMRLGALECWRLGVLGQLDRLQHRPGLIERFDVLGFGN
jgi:hypothetical protein